MIRVGGGRLGHPGHADTPDWGQPPGLTVSGDKWLVVRSGASDDPSAISTHCDSQPGQRYTGAPSTSCPVFTVPQASRQGLETRWRIMDSMVPEPGISHTLRWRARVTHQRPRQPQRRILTESRQYSDRTGVCSGHRGELNTSAGMTSEPV